MYYFCLDLNFGYSMLNNEKIIISLFVSDAPNDSLYMIGGVCVAMLMVGVIIILLAVTIR